MTIKWRHCAVAERDHRKDVRNYAHTFHYPQTICFAKAFWKLPREYRDGILLHEIGHLLAGPEGSESEANDAVFDWTGTQIEYVDSPYGRRLERVKNMAGVAIIRRRLVTMNPSTSEWEEDFYRKGFDAGKKDQHAEYPMFSGDGVIDQAARMAGIAVEYHDLRPSKADEVSNAFIRGYYDGFRGHRRRVNPDDPEDIDWKQRYGETEQPEVARYLGHERPADRPEADSPRAFWKQRADGKYHVEFVYPRSGARVTKIMTKQKFDAMVAKGDYLVYHSSR